MWPLQITKPIQWPLFILSLNSRLKEILFINKNKKNYAQFMMLAMILNFEFKSYDTLLDKIQEYL